jgi:hypothetical protein
MTTRSVPLIPHPATPCPAIRAFEATAEASARPQAIAFRFRIAGDVARIRLAEPGFARRSDGLWQHSCFEAFLRADASERYYEFNFAPSGDWAAYGFGARRSGRRAPALPAPAIESRRARDAFELSARVSFAALPALGGAASIHAGLAAVIEDADGTLSYWALAHAGKSPDFHDPATFTLRVTTP